MRTFLVLLLLTLAVDSTAQTCITPAPPAPPKARGALISFNPDGGLTTLEDGGTAPCTIQGVTDDGQKRRDYPVTGVAKCNTARAMADTAVSNDNGWNDGGTP